MLYGTVADPGKAVSQKRPGHQIPDIPGDKKSNQRRRAENSAEIMQGAGPRPGMLAQVIREKFLERLNILAHVRLPGIMRHLVDVYVNVNYNSCPIVPPFTAGRQALGKESRYSITDLASEFGVTSRTIRFYEDRGMLAPDRQGQTRIYSARDRARLAWILRGKRVGFSLGEIAEMLDLYDLEDGRVTQRQVTLNKCRERIKALRQQRDDIDLTIGELEEFCRILEDELQHSSASGRTGQAAE